MKPLTRKERTALIRVIDGADVYGPAAVDMYLALAARGLARLTPPTTIVPKRGAIAPAAFGVIATDDGILALRSTVLTTKKARLLTEIEDAQDMIRLGRLMAMGTTLEQLLTNVARYIRVQGRKEGA